MLEFYEPNELIFEYSKYLLKIDSLGEKFYIILQGEVTVGVVKGR